MAPAATWVGFCAAASLFAPLPAAARSDTTRISRRNRRAYALEASGRPRDGLDREDVGDDYLYLVRFLRARYPWRFEAEDRWALDDDIRDLHTGPCRMYIAESSIPNAGLGAYSGVAVGDRKPVSNPEIGIILVDMAKHAGNLVVRTLIDDYTWTHWVLQFGQFFADKGQAAIPGLGMMPNSHMALSNLVIDEPMRIPNFHEGLLDRTRDVGAGASSGHFDVRSKAIEPIQAGAELFLNYGGAWFEIRESTLGAVPQKENYEEANEIVKDFLGRMHEVSNLDARKREWKDVLDSWGNKNPRTRAALPNDVEDLERAAKVGTALHLLPGAIRSIEWLEENGVCNDNLRAGPSTIPQAGRGAFTNHYIPEGGIIAPAPLLHIHRRALAMYDWVDGPDGRQKKSEKVASHQLLMNYCWGHENSSVVLFPYSSGVHFINHGGEKANARIQWSTWRNRADWFEDSPEVLIKRMRAGLMFDIVATRDISPMEEVLLDYGTEWEEAWGRFVWEWSPSPRAGQLASILNADNLSVIRTISEQETKPYPDVQTICFYHDDRDLHPNGAQVPAAGSNDTSVRWHSPKRGLLQRNLRPCDILSRRRIRGRDYYTARVRNYADAWDTNIIDDSGGQGRMVSDMPRWAIQFTPALYATDQLLRGVFRHPIGIPDNVMPTKWLDGGA